MRDYIDIRRAMCSAKCMPDWKRAREAAERLAPGEPELGWLTWLESMLKSGGEPPMSGWWFNAYRDFWRSGKRQMTASVGRRGTKSSSNCRVAFCEAIYRPRRQVLGTELVWPILSVDMHEANGRFATLKAIACKAGLTPVDAQNKVTADTFFASSTQGGRSKIMLLDADGRPIEFRIAPASVSGASGYTGIGATCDEMDLWHDKETNANPAGVVLDMLLPTLRGQRGAHAYVFSAPFGERGPHTLMVRDGDTEGQFVARLGELGARLDNEARRGLAAHFAERAREAPSAHERARAAKYSADQRLHEPANPDSTAIPSWVANPTDDDGNGPHPVAAILECYTLASRKAGQEGEDPLIELLARYGARPYAAGGHRLFDLAVLDAAAQRSPLL